MYKAVAPTKSYLTIGGCCIDERRCQMGSKKDSLGNRMKRYENVSRLYLTRRVPVIIRVDGKAFHTYTKGMKKPFDRILMTVMQQTMQYLCENIQGCVFGYTQSDEITLVLTDYKTASTDAWFGNGVQKMCSVAASMATMAFNRFFAAAYFDLSESIEEAWNVSDEERAYVGLLYDKLLSATFDARVFSVPKDEVCNCLIWRQQDATRNSIEAAGQAHFSHRQLHKKNCDQIQEMLWQERGINWNDYPVDFKRGSCCRRQKTIVTMPDPRDDSASILVERNRWVVDKKPPIFTQDRSYIEFSL